LCKVGFEEPAMSRSDASPYAAEPQIAPLTALRFFAAAWVVLYHYWPNLDADFVPHLAAKGYLGVELFFVLSGFVISYVYQGAFEQGRLRYGAFLWARLARIYPLHLATLAAVILMALGAAAAGLQVASEVFDPASLPANLLLVHAWGFAPSAAFNHPSWSISAEWFAYLSFPLFAAVAVRLTARPVLAVAGAGLLVFALYAGFEAAAGFPLTQATIAWGALRIVPCFALGCAVHLLWRARVIRGRRAAVTLAATTCLTTLALGAAGAPDALLTVSFGALILGLAQLWSTREPSMEQGKALNLFAYLGEISYSTYMICIPWKLLFVNAATKALGIEGDQLPLSIWLIFILSLIPLSAASYHLVEGPARRWLKLHAPGRRRGATLQPAG
jgi:peptidoglycan/LPS O-acetylase OafA/YrhL